VAGADVSFSKYDPTLFAAVVVLELPEFREVDRASVIGTAEFPYIPGLLSFREAPVLLQAFEKLQTTPDVVLFDGQGLAHPRRFGLASHMGLLLDIPAVGCAKTYLVGEYESLGPKKGDWAPLVHRGEVVGAALRSRDDVAPIFVSIGHKVDLETAIRVVMACLGGYRIPEPLRRAHLLVNEIRKDHQEKEGKQLWLGLE